VVLAFEQLPHVGQRNHTHRSDTERIFCHQRDTRSVTSDCGAHIISTRDVFILVVEYRRRNCCGKSDHLRKCGQCKHHCHVRAHGPDDVLLGHHLDVRHRCRRAANSTATTSPYRDDVHNLHDHDTAAYRDHDDASASVAPTPDYAHDAAPRIGCDGNDDITHDNDNDNDNDNDHELAAADDCNHVTTAATNDDPNNTADENSSTAELPDHVPDAAAAEQRPLHLDGGITVRRTN
jgi:hypothetical protein